MVTFNTGQRSIDNVTFRVVSFVRETTGKNGKLFELTVYPDGSEHYSVNCASVDALPDYPSTRELKSVAGQCKAGAVKMLGFVLGSDEYNAAWWSLKALLQEINAK